MKRAARAARLLLMTFRPPLWLASPHVQTLGAALPWWVEAPRAASPRVRERLVIPLPDARAPHGTFGLVAHAAWHGEGGDASARRTTALLVHGVGGDAESNYLRRAALSLYRAGMNVVRLNLRGAGEGIACAPSLYHAGLVEDLERAIDGVLADPRAESVVLVGFSLGGNASLCLAGSWGERPHPGVRAVVAVSPPLDLVEVSRWLERRRSLPYARYVLRNLIDEGRSFARIRPDRVRYDAGALAGLRRIRDYDELVVVPMHDFPSVDAYYRETSAGPRLGRITVPTLIVHAADDPMIPEASMHGHLARRSPAVELAWTARGGHVGWFEGVGEDAFVDTWPMRRLVAFVEGLRGRSRVGSTSAPNDAGRDPVA